MGFSSGSKNNMDEKSDLGHNNGGAARLCDTPDNVHIDGDRDLCLGKSTISRSKLRDWSQTGIKAGATLVTNERGTGPRPNGRIR